MIRHVIVTAAAAVLLGSVLGPAAATVLADDSSDYPGTDCTVDEFFDASSQDCASDVVTNDPQAPIDPNKSGTSDPGKDCGADDLFDVLAAQCIPEVVTNDPDAVVNLEGEDPTNPAIPTLSAPPGV